MPLAKDYRAALEALRAIVGDLADDQPGLTVAAVLEAYRADCEARVSRGKLKRVTARQYRSKGDPPPSLAALPCSELTGEAVEAWLASRTDWLPITRRDHARVLKQAVRFAARTGLLSKDPLADWRLPVVRARRLPLPEGDVLTRLLEASPPCLRELLEFLRDTGCRVGEARAIEARHLEGDVVVLGEHKTERYGDDRVIVLPERWAVRLAELATMHPTGPLMRGSYGQPWQPEAVSQAVKRARRRAGLGDGVVARLLRHLWATRAVEGGADIKTVQQQLGHRTPRVTLEVYARARLATVRATVRKLAS